MKHLLLLSLFLFSSCAIYQELFGPQPSGIPIARTPRPVETNPEEILAEAKTYRSMDGAATLIIYPGQIQVALKIGKMSYREGHSVELIIDGGAPVIQRVVPTDNHIVHFSNSARVAELIKGKKKVQIELYLDGSGLKVFTFIL